MYASDCNVFCITETWLSDQISDGEILPSNFVLYRSDRPSRGGGVLIAVHESIYSALVSSPFDLEVVSVRLGLDNHFVVCCKWFNSEIRHHQKCLRSMRRKCKSCPTLRMKNKIQQSEKLLQSRIEQAKANYESKLIESYHSRSHSSAIHSYIRSISGLNSLPAVMTLDSNSAASDKEKAILFNQYFHSVFSASSFPLPSTSELTRPNSFIDAVIFNELDVFKGLRALDVQWDVMASVLWF